MFSSLLFTRQTLFSPSMEGRTGVILDSDYSFSDSSKFPHIDNEGFCLTILDNPDKQRPSSCFLGYYSKYVLLEGTLMTWFHYSNLNWILHLSFHYWKWGLRNPESLSSHHPFSLRSFLRSWMFQHLIFKNNLTLFFYLYIQILNRRTVFLKEEYDIRRWYF